MRTPLRVLVVGLALLMVGWCVLSLVSLLARGNGEANGTYSGVTSLVVDTGFESVDITESPEATKVSLERTYHWSLGRPTVKASRQGDVLTVSSSCPFQVGIGCTGKVHLQVPAGVDVRAETSDGGLTLRGLTGTVDAATADGDIEATGLTGELAFRVKDGSIDAADIRNGNVAAQSADGDVRLTFAVLPTSVTGSSKDGSITVLVPPGKTAYDVDVSVKDGSRDVDVPTDPDSDRHITLEAADGSLTVARR
jgi:hypothetical protein